MRPAREARRLFDQSNRRPTRKVASLPPPPPRLTARRHRGVSDRTTASTHRSAAPSAQLPPPPAATCRRSLGTKTPPKTSLAARHGSGSTAGGGHRDNAGRGEPAGVIADYPRVWPSLTDYASPIAALNESQSLIFRVIGIKAGNRLKKDGSGIPPNCSAANTPICNSSRALGVGPLHLQALSVSRPSPSPGRHLHGDTIGRVPHK
uniref:Uncharacterized protein n=1 Tax=Plectus sambesii TaxID=2011161 RepID=A0A914VR10_9BILA